MDIHTNLWTPMTCQCQIHFRYDRHEGHKLDGTLIRHGVHPSGKPLHPTLDRFLTDKETARIVDTMRHEFHRFEKKCPKHAAMDDQAAWADIVKANPSTTWGTVPDLTCGGCIEAHKGKS